MFSSSPPVQEDAADAADAAEAHRQKAKLHERFVRKLGKPDSLASLRRKSKGLAEEPGEGEEDDQDDEADDDAPAKRGKGRKGAAPKASKLTPMEKQYLDIKRKHLDALIIMEVGYKFRLLGEDARVASKELGLVCIPGKFRYDERRCSALHARPMY